jgi:hypothetical protein
MREALAAWLRTHEAETTTLDGYRGYIERTIDPALGDVPVSSITVRVLEELYADLRRCRKRCRDGEPALDRRTAGPHECRQVRVRADPSSTNPRMTAWRPGARSWSAHGTSASRCPPLQSCKSTGF